MMIQIDCAKPTIILGDCAATMESISSISLEQFEFDRRDVTSSRYIS